MPPSIFISAGEASGEHYGALLVAALKRQLAAAGHTAAFFGMGGTRMEAAGLERIVRAEDMAVMGLTEVLLHLPRIYGEYRKLKRAIRARRPAVAVLIDFPGLHFKLAAEFHRLGIPVIFFVSPQLWAWKKGRIKKVRKFIDQMLVIFPFEETFYRDHGVAAEFVGHPLAELPAPTVSREQFALNSGLDPEKTWIALLPGSRPKEIRSHLAEILLAAQELVVRGRAGSEPSNQFEFILPLAPTLDAGQRKNVYHLLDDRAGGLPIKLVEDARAALHHARASVVASGTATVEAALIGNPFIVIYRVSPVTYAIAKRLVKVPHVAMVNLIADKRVVPELIQSDFTAKNIVQQIERLLPDGPPRQSMMQELAGIRGLLRAGLAGSSKLGDGAIERVAQAVLKLMIF
jgi:lipid-A-disaccharide synthase